MTRLSDETLMAYADGTLDADTHRKVERQLMRDAAARHLVHLMSLVRVLVQTAYGERDFTSGSERLIRTIEGAGARVAPKRSSGPKLSLALLLGGSAVGAAMAASLATALVLDSGLVRSDGDADALAIGPLARRTELAQALERMENPASLPYRTGSAHFQQVAAFKDKFGNACHEVDAFTPGQFRVPNAVLVACRVPDDGWRLVSIVSTRPGSPGRSRLYVDSENEAHQALTGILSMIGATSRTTAIDTEIRPQ